MAGFLTPGVTRLSELEIDADKDWGGKSITNMTQISIGDVVFANNWRLTEVLDGIALLDEKGKIIRRWTNG
ncbi:hypothetical protein ES706_06063 [subsurface metagenome]